MNCGVPFIKECKEGVWRCVAEKCKILFPRINLLCGSVRWLGMLSWTESWHGQLLSFCVGFLPWCVFRQHASLASVWPFCLAPRSNSS